MALAASACSLGDADDGQRVEPRTVRWIPGLGATAVTETSGERADDRLGPPPAGCHSGDAAALVLVAEVMAGSRGPETVIAASAHGVVVLDAEGRRVGALPFDCGGSADRMVALAVGDAHLGTPVISVVAVAGGHREETTRVELLAFRDGVLARLFAAAIETRDGDAIAVGELRVTEDGLLHRDPDGHLTEWRADPWTHQFVLVR